MREEIIETKVRVYNINECEQKSLFDSALFDSALSAAKNAYAPYSGFQVGAAVLLEDGAIVIGSNQENAAYPSGLCAERVALFSAGAQFPNLKVKSIAIAAITNNMQVEHVAPCGACRQVLLEAENRCGNPIQIVLCGTEEVKVIGSAKELLPVSFVLDK